MQAAVRGLTVVSLQIAVGVVFVCQRRHATCRAGNETNMKQSVCTNNTPK